MCTSNLLAKWNIYICISIILGVEEVQSYSFFAFKIKYTILQYIYLTQSVDHSLYIECKKIFT